MSPEESWQFLGVLSGTPKQLYWEYCCYWGVTSCPTLTSLWFCSLLLKLPLSAMGSGGYLQNCWWRTQVVQSAVYLGKAYSRDHCLHTHVRSSSKRVLNIASCPSEVEVTCPHPRQREWKPRLRAVDLSETLAGAGWGLEKRGGEGTRDREQNTPCGTGNRPAFLKSLPEPQYKRRTCWHLLIIIPVPKTETGESHGYCWPGSLAQSKSSRPMRDPYWWLLKNTWSWLFCLHTHLQTCARTHTHTF